MRGFRDEEAGPSDLVDIDCLVIRESETGRAWFIDTGRETAWVPKSQSERDGLTLTMPRWMAEEKGLA